MDENLTEIGNNGNESGKIPENNSKMAARLANLLPPWSSENQPEGRGHPLGQSNTVAKAKRSLVKDLIAELEKSLPKAVKEHLEKFYPDENLHGMDQGTGLMKKLVMLGFLGDSNTIFKILGYIDGLPLQRTQHTGDINQPIVINCNDTGFAEELKKDVENGL